METLGFGVEAYFGESECGMGTREYNYCGRYLWGTFMERFINPKKKLPPENAEVKKEHKNADISKIHIPDRSQSGKVTEVVQSLKLPTIAPKVVEPKEKPMDDEPIIITNTVMITRKYPELTCLQVQILNYVYHARSPFPRTAWCIANWITDKHLPNSDLTNEEFVAKELNYLAESGKYQIRKVPYNHKEGFEPTFPIGYFH
jgi:hypothetical protein